MVKFTLCKLVLWVQAPLTPMKKTTLYDNIRRERLKIKEFDLLFVKLLLNNSRVSTLYKVLYLFRLKKKKIFLSKVNNICVLTNRARGVYKGFKVSRIVLRKLGSEGLIPGLKKSS